METAKCGCGKTANRKLSLEPEIGFVYFCSDECRDKVKDKLKYHAEYEITDDERYRQGKSEDSYRSSMILVTIAGIALAIISIITVLYYVYGLLVI